MSFLLTDFSNPCANFWWFFYTLIHCKSSVRITLWYLHIFEHESNTSAGAGCSGLCLVRFCLSPRMKTPATFLGSRFLCLTTHNKKGFFLIFELNIPSFSLSLALSMHIAQNSLTLHTIPSCICTHGWDPPEPSLLQTAQLFQPLCVWQMLQALYCTLLDSLQYVCILLFLDTNTRCLTRAEQRWRITYSPQLTGNAVSNAAQKAVEIRKMF